MHKFMFTFTVAIVIMAIAGCGKQSPVSVQSNSSQVASSRGDYAISCLAKDTVTGKMLLLAGSLENTWTNLHYRNQTSGSTWAGWVTNSSIFTGPLATCNSGIGGQKRLYLFNIGTNYHLFYNIATSSTLPNGWIDLGALPSGANVAQPKVAKLGLSPTSPLIVFASTQSGYIWFKGTNSSGNFPTSSSSWIQIPSPAASDFDVCTKNDGTIFVAFRNPNTQYISVAIISSPTAVSNYYGQGLLQTIGQIAVGKNQDGRMEIYTFTSGNPYPIVNHSWENSVNSNNWSSWTTFFGPSGRTLNSLVPFNLAVVSNSDGRLELFYQQNTAYNVFHTYQTAVNSSWADESALYPSGDQMHVYGPSLSAAKGQDDKLYVAIRGQSSFVYMAQTIPSQGWDAPVSLGDY